MKREEVARVIDSAELRIDAGYREIETLCCNAREYGFHAVCVYPFWVRSVKHLLKGSEVKVCAVIAFPHGMSLVKEEECARVITQGADEIDMVMNISAYLSRGEHRKRILQEMERCTDLAKGRDVTLKVIIEYPVLPEGVIPELIEDLLTCGVDFIKTATGTRGDTSPEMVRHLSGLLKGRARIKAAGGIRTLSRLEEMVQAGASRIGTSSAVEIMREAK